MCERHSSFRLGAIVSPDYLWGVSRTFTIFSLLDPLLGSFGDPIVASKVLYLFLKLLCAGP